MMSKYLVNIYQDFIEKSFITRRLGQGNALYCLPSPTSELATFSLSYWLKVTFKQNPDMAELNLVQKRTSFIELEFD